MLRKTIASAFRSKGKRRMDRKELTYTLSFDLKFFSHETSKKIVDHAEKKGLIHEVDGILQPSFDVDEIEIEPDFKPDVNRIFSDGSIFERIVDRIVEETGKDRGSVIAEINQKQLHLGNIMDIEIVALIYAIENEIDVRDFIEEVEREMLGR